MVKPQKQQNKEKNSWPEKRRMARNMLHSRRDQSPQGDFRMARIKTANGTLALPKTKASAQKVRCAPARFWGSSS
jgi:hypothetical protein